MVPWEALDSRWVCWLFIGLFPAFTAAAERPPTPAKIADGKDPDPAHLRLIYRLGDPAFVVRQHVFAKLTYLGLKARPALLVARKHPDLEVRMRAHEILVRALQRDFDRQIAAFTADRGKGTRHDLPGWKSYHKIVGGDARSRDLFVRMVRQEVVLLEAYRSAAADLPDRFAERSDSLSPYRSGRYEGPPASAVESAAALLLIAADPKAKVEVATLSHVMIRLQRQISSSPDADLIRSLVQEWVKSKTSGLSDFSIVQFSLTYELKRPGLDAARRMLKANPASMNPTSMKFPASAIARFGALKDVRLLLPYLDNERLLMRLPAASTQVRDYALAMLLVMTKQDPRDYGFRSARRLATGVYTISGFGNAAARAKAHADWAVWWKRKSAGDAQ